MRGLLTCICVRKRVRAVCRLRLIRRVSGHAVSLLLPFIYIQTIGTNEKCPTLGSVLGCKGRRALTHLSMPFCVHGKCRGGCLKPSLCRSLHCGFRCKSCLRVNIAKRGSTKRPFFTLRGEGNCSCCSFCFLVGGLKQLGTLTLNGCHLDFKRKLMLDASFHLKGAFSVSAARCHAKNVHGRDSASRCGCFQKITTAIKMLPCLSVSTFCSRHSVSNIIRSNRVASVCGAKLRHARGRTSGVGTFTLRIVNKGVACRGGSLGIKIAKVCCFFGRPCGPQLGGCTGCGLRKDSFCGINVSCECHLNHFI